MSQDSPEWCFDEPRRVCFEHAAAAPAAASDEFSTEVSRAVSIKTDSLLGHDHVALAERQTLVSIVPEKSAALPASSGLMGLLMPSPPLASAALPTAPASVVTTDPALSSALPYAPVSRPLSVSNPFEEDDIALSDMSAVLGDIAVPSVLQPQPAPQVITPAIMSLLAPPSTASSTTCAAAATTTAPPSPSLFSYPSSSSMTVAGTAPPPLPSECSTPFSLSWSSFHVQGLDWRPLMSSLRGVLDQQGISSVAGGCEWQLSCTFPSAASGLSRRKPSFSVSVYASADLAYAVEFKLGGGTARPFRSAFNAVVTAFESLPGCTVQTTTGDSSPLGGGSRRGSAFVAGAESVGSPLPSHPKMTILE